MRKLTYGTIIFMLVSVVLCSLLSTLLVFKFWPVIVGEKVQHGTKYSLPNGMELYRSDFGDSQLPYYVLGQDGDGIVSLYVDEDLKPTSINVLGGDEPQLDVALRWESREIIGISRYRANGDIIYDKDGDGMPDVRVIHESPDGPVRDKDIFFQERWLPVENEKEKLNVELPNGEVLPVEFRDGQFRRTEDE